MKWVGRRPVQIQSTSVWSFRLGLQRIRIFRGFVLASNLDVLPQLRRPPFEAREFAFGSVVVVDVLGGIASRSEVTLKIERGQFESVHIWLEVRTADSGGQALVKDGRGLFGTSFGLLSILDPHPEPITRIGRINGLGLAVKIATPRPPNRDQAEHEGENRKGGQACDSRGLTCHGEWT